MSAELIDALDARAGLVCMVGAGGKKTSMYRLANAHPGRVGVTSTVYIPYFPASLQAAKVVTHEPDLMGEVVRLAPAEPKLAFALSSDKRARHGGLSPDLIPCIHDAAGFDVTLIKADGARAKRIKAPGEGEPRIPCGTRTVIPVVSARAIGAPLDEKVAHRVPRVAAVTGAHPDEPITPEHLAILLASPQGALKDVGHARVVPLINMVDDTYYEKLARAAARRALSLSNRFDRVVLARMNHPNALVGIVSR